MVFANLDELIHMGGHGPYVWVSYAVAVVGLAALVVLPLLTRRRLLRDIARRARRDAATDVATDAATQAASKPAHTDSEE